MRLEDSAFESDWTFALRKARKDRKLKQAAVAQKLGITAPNLCHWENGVSCPSTFVLWNKWAELVGMPHPIADAPEIDYEET